MMMKMTMMMMMMMMMVNKGEYETCMIAFNVGECANLSMYHLQHTCMHAYVRSHVCRVHTLIRGTWPSKLNPKP